MPKAKKDLKQLAAALVEETGSPENAQLVVKAMRARAQRANSFGEPDLQGLRGVLQDALMQLHRASKRKKKATEAVDAAEQDLKNATRNGSIDGKPREEIAMDLVLRLEELAERDEALKEARKSVKAAEKNLEVAGWKP
jgi:hypothetical protein